MLIDERVRGIVRDERGVTLAEILVATIVISIGLVGLAMVIPLSSYGVYQGNALSTATFLAEQKLEEVRNTTWTCPGSGVLPCPVANPPSNDCLGLSSGNSAPTSNNCARSLPAACVAGTTCTTYSDESAVTNYPAYSRTVRITDCGSGGGCAGVVTSSMRLVTVTVTYVPMTGVGGLVTAGGQSAVLQMMVSRRQ